MAHSVRLVVVALLGLCGSANAAYVYPNAPDGWRSNRPMTHGEYRAKTVIDSINNKVIFSPNALTVPTAGTATKFPVAYRLASSAPRVAAAILFSNPYVRTGVAIASWLNVGKLVWDEVSQTWSELAEETHTDGKQWRFMEQPWTTVTGACNQAIAHYNQLDAGTGYSSSLLTCNAPSGFVRRRTHDVYGHIGNFGFSLESRTVTSVECPLNWSPSPAGCLSPALAEPEFVDKLAPSDMPDGVVFELPPDSYLPVEQPVVNPEAGPSPVARSRFVPTGNPIPNPDYDPNAPASDENKPFIQPGVRLVPSPTELEPWRVDVVPINRPVPNSDPTVPTDEGSGQGNPGDKPKEDPPGLCEMYPDILACAKTGDLAATPVPNENRALQITPDTGYGPSNGACPAPRTAVIMGQSISMPFDLLCTFADSIRPIVIAFAWLTAALTFFGLGRKDS